MTFKSAYSRFFGIIIFDNIKSNPMKDFVIFQTKEGTKLVSRSSIALMEDLKNLSYRITLKECREDGNNITFTIEADYAYLLKLLS